jgi:hypothetical protein
MQSLRKYIGNAWTPLDLFANGEPGFWYDPSDLSTMFQDSNGTIPMQPVGTVADQPVGLILDKSRGLVGPELLVNGTFTTGITGWAETPPGVASVSGGKLVLTSASAGLTYPLVTQQLPALQVGKLYKLSFYRRNISANEGIGIQLGETAGSAGLAQIAVSTNTSGEVVSLYWLATVTTVWVTVFAKCQNAGETAEADDVSFIEIPGNHAFQATSPARPVLSARVNLLTETQDFNTAAWLDNGVTVTPNAIIAPDGTLTGDKISSTLSFFGLIQKYQLGKTVSGPIEHSAYLKKGEVDWCMLNAYVTTDIRAWFDLTNGVVGIVEGAMTASIEDAGDGWWKCSVFQTVTGMATNAGISFEPTNADGVGAIDWVAGEGLYVWGAQLAPRGQGHKYQRVKNAADYDASGFPTFLKLEGVDDGLGTTNFSMTGTNKATVFAGYANGKTGSTGTLLEFSANYMNNGGGFALLVPSLSTSNVSFGSHGTLGAGEKDAPAAPAGGLEKRVLTAYQDFATLNDYGCDYVRANSIPLTSLVGVGNTDVGAGPFGTFPAFIGSRNNAANFMNGNIYSLTLAGNGYDTQTIENMENYIDSKLNP